MRFDQKSHIFGSPLLHIEINILILVPKTKCYANYVVSLPVMSDPSTYFMKPTHFFAFSCNLVGVEWHFYTIFLVT